MFANKSFVGLMLLLWLCCHLCRFGKHPRYINTSSTNIVAFSYKAKPNFLAKSFGTRGDIERKRESFKGSYYLGTMLMQP